MGKSEIILMGLWFVFPVCIFLAWFFWHRARHKERLMMIEKGLNISDNPQDAKKMRNKLATVGMIIVGLGVGLAIIALLLVTGQQRIVNSGPAPLAILVICGGISLVLANRRKTG